MAKKDYDKLLDVEIKIEDTLMDNDVAKFLQTLNKPDLSLSKPKAKKFLEKAIGDLQDCLDDVENL
jgi:hypothetical protein